MVALPSLAAGSYPQDPELKMMIGSLETFIARQGDCSLIARIRNAGHFEKRHGRLVVADELTSWVASATILRTFASLTRSSVALADVSSATASKSTDGPSSIMWWTSIKLASQTLTPPTFGAMSSKTLSTP